MRKATFENVLFSYMAFAAILALALPHDLVMERHFPLDPVALPFAGWLRHAPGALPFLTTYFCALTVLLPVVVVLLARHPQGQVQFHYKVPSLRQCIGGTVVAAAIALLALVGSYGEHRLSQGPPSSRGALLFQLAAASRLGLALAGPVLMGTLALSAYIALVKVPRMWMGFRAGVFG